MRAVGFMFGLCGVWFMAYGLGYGVATHRVTPGTVAIWFVGTVAFLWFLAPYVPLKRRPDAE